MITTQEYLDQNYPQDRKEITKLDLNKKDLQGELDLSDFVNLEELNCSDNKLTSLNLDNCSKLKILYCFNNQLTELKINHLNKLEFLGCRNNQLTQLNLPNPNQIQWINASDNNLKDLSFLSALSSEKMTSCLAIFSNNFPDQDLSIFSRFVNLKELHISNLSGVKNDQDIYNRFYGNLEVLNGLNKLEKLDIRDTDIDSGLEYLSEGIKEFSCSALGRKDAKVKAIYNLFANDQGIVETEGYGYIKNFPQKFQLYKQKPQIKDRIKKVLNTDEITTKQLNQQLINDYITNQNQTWQDYLDSSALNLSEFDTRKEKILTTIKNLKTEKKKSKQEEERRVITSLVPTERLFVIRGNLKQFINKWGKEHENDWYEWLKKFITCSRRKKNNELVELQSPKDRGAKIDKGIIVGLRSLSNSLAVSGIALSFQSSDKNNEDKNYDKIGAGLLGAYPISEFIVGYLDKSLESRENKWKEFLNDADSFSDNFNELLGIIEKIDDSSELGKTQTVKELKESTKKLLEIYDKDEKGEEGYKEIDLEELIEERVNLAQDLADKTKSKWWGIIKDIRKLENFVINYQKTGSLEVDKTNQNQSTTQQQTGQQQVALQIQPAYSTPGSSNPNNP